MKLNKSRSKSYFRNHGKNYAIAGLTVAVLALGPCEKKIKDFYSNSIKPNMESIFTERINKEEYMPKDSLNSSKTVPYPQEEGLKESAEDKQIEVRKTHKPKPKKVITKEPKKLQQKVVKKPYSSVLTQEEADKRARYALDILDKTQIIEKQSDIEKIISAYELKPGKYSLYDRTIDKFIETEEAFEEYRLDIDENPNLYLKVKDREAIANILTEALDNNQNVYQVSYFDSRIKRNVEGFLVSRPGKELTFDEIKYNGFFGLGKSTNLGVTSNFENLARIINYHEDKNNPISGAIHRITHVHMMGEGAGNGSISPTGGNSGVDSGNSIDAN